jgi:rhamnosyltransferase subunit B
LANIICSSLGSGGDILPFLRIGSRLRRRGHHVTLISHCYWEDAAEKAGIHFCAIDSAPEYSRFVNDEPLLNSPRGIPEFLRRHVFTKVPAEYDIIRQRSRTDQTFLITRDLFDTGIRISAEKLGIPFMTIFVAPSQLATWKIRVELFRQACSDEINRLRNQMSLPSVSNWKSWLAYPATSLALWPDWFAGSDPAWPPGVTPVGFIIDQGHSDQVPADLQTYLSSGEQPILITGGTGLYLGAEFYKTSAEACSLLKRRAVLVTQHREHVPEDFRDSFRWFDYLPFNKVMKNVAAVIHHGGRGTLSSAIAAGVPQLVLAMGADRPDNAIRLKGLGVADYLPPPAWQPAAVAEKLSAIIHSEVVAQTCRTLAARMAATDALGSACDLIERVIAEGQG